jgi:hypothetical protein
MDDNTQQLNKKQEFKFSKKGFDFSGKPIDETVDRDKVFAVWANRIFLIGEKKNNECCLYEIKGKQAVYCFTVKYKNLILAIEK